MVFLGLLTLVFGSGLAAFELRFAGFGSRKRVGVGATCGRSIDRDYEVLSVPRRLVERLVALDQAN